jgi:hypothetical protein
VNALQSINYRAVMHPLLRCILWESRSLQYSVGLSERQTAVVDNADGQVAQSVYYQNQPRLPRIAIYSTSAAFSIPEKIWLNKLSSVL